MSRRKQSNPKPVKRDDLPGGMEEESLNGDTKSTAISDDEDIEEDGVSLTNSSPSPSDAGKSAKAPAKRRRETDSDAEASPLPPPPLPLPPPPPPPTSTPSHPLLSADLIQSLQYFALLRQSLPNGSLMSVAAPPAPPPPSRVTPPPPPPAIKSSASGLNHNCPSCGICFSSASTLSAHVTYYCSKRPPVAPVVNEPIANQTDVVSNGRSQTPEINDEMGDRPPAPKIRRSGRYYACPYCSFSADKRVSLNRHMRVHVGLPLLATHPVSPPPPLPVDSPRSNTSDSGKTNDDPDRYCAECKIQFTSFKTFQVHKQHYCQSRKALPPGSPVPEKAAAMDSRVQQTDAANGQQMTILVLPTHPPIVIPLSILQSARLLTPEQPIPHQAVIVSPLGEIQFRSESPEDSKPLAGQLAARPTSSASTPAPGPIRAQQTSPVAIQTPVNPLPASPAINASSVPAPASIPATPPIEPKADTALDLSAKGPDQAETPANDTAPKEVGNIRIREELAHVNPAEAQPTQPALPFLPPKEFAELEALGMYLGVPSDMTSNPAQWLAMLENAVLQASLNPAASSALLPPVAANKPEMIAPRPSSAIPCEECNISFRRMESYLVHKQYYCAARHQTPQAPAVTKETSTPQPGPEAVNGTDEPVVQQRPAKMGCPQCGIEFESAVILQAHRTFYCPKKDPADPVKLAPSKVTVSQEPPLIPAQNHGPSPTAGGSGPVQPQGWKCPCCDVVSPTAAAAQKHIETHSNVRAFRCTVCGYRGNTLRGMRTHVRIHFDRRNADLCEDNYIACIMSGNEPGSPPDVDQLLKTLGIPPELCAKLFSAGNPAAQEAVAALMAASGRDRRDVTNSSLAGLQFLQLAQRLANHSPGPTTGAGCRSDKLFLCDLCCYSSSYRGNVIRHSKLVHGRELNDVAVVSSNFLQQAVNNNPAKAGFPDASPINRKPMTEHHSSSPPTRPGLVGTPSSVRLTNSGSPDEAIQVKIDPDDVMLMSSTGGSSSSGAHSPMEASDYANQSASTGPPAGEAFRKHCKSCNITFTYMNTFLAHKKYYCSSQTTDDQDRDVDMHNSDRDLREDDEMDDEDDEVKAVTAAPSPPRPTSAHRSEATPT